MAVRAIEILNNLYGLMMEINYHKSDEDVLRELKESPDLFVEDHLMKIKRTMAKYRAMTNRNRIDMAMDQLRKLKEKGLDEVKKLLTPQEQVELAPLFRKFEELTPEDEASILEDQQLLKLLEKLQKESTDEQGD